MIEDDKPQLANSNFFDEPGMQKLPVRIEKSRGGTKVFLGDQEVTLPIREGGINVERDRSWNILKLDIIVGDVSMDSTPNKEG